MSGTGKVSNGTFDCVVIGGGIIAAAAGQHLSAAGYKTLLAECGDYGGGTSSRTSRLQHCGLGYLSIGKGSLGAFLRQPGKVLESLDLMRRSMKGRAEFVRLHPERVRPVRFVVPLTADNAIPRWKARLAFSLMTASDGGRVPLESRILSPQEARDLPALQGMAGLHDLRGAICFTEYQYVWPERIVVDTVMMARALGLEALNHSPVVAIRREDSLWRVAIDTPDGRRDVLARSVVNCAGVWVDQITAMAGGSHLRRNIGQKGTNIALRLPENLRGIGIETVTAEGFPFYLIPWGDLHYAGPWDSPSDGAPEDFRATEQEIVAILGQIAQMFPATAIGREEVLYCWAGVRPRSLAADGSGVSAAVREHDLTDAGLPNFFVFTGGLLMTHREAGRRLTKAVARRQRPSGTAPPPVTAVTALPDMDIISTASIAQAVRHEQARTLSDILRRRLSIGWGEDLGLNSAAEAARLAAPLLGWSELETAAQIEGYRAETEAEFGFALPIAGRQSVP